MRTLLRKPFRLCCQSWIERPGVLPPSGNAITKENKISSIVRGAADRRSLGEATHCSSRVVSRVKTASMKYSAASSSDSDGPAGSGYRQTAPGRSQGRSGAGKVVVLSPHDDNKHTQRWPTCMFNERTVINNPDVTPFIIFFFAPTDSHSVGKRSEYRRSKACFSPERAAHGGAATQEG